jgi:RNA polymerase sigma-70 factor (ECF subfamily)
VRDDRDEAFTALYVAHWPRVAGYCVGLVRSVHLGDELAQEAFVRLYAKWGRPADPLAYVYRIAHNLAVDQRRRAAREENQMVVAMEETVDHDLLDAVLRLPPRLRDVTLLHYYADLTTERVAEILKRPVGTVRRQLHQARENLAVALAEESP